MMALLHIASLRRGAEGMDSKSPYYANVDESKANPYPELPNPLVLNNGSHVRNAREWFSRRRPEIVEDFDREVYGRVPKRTPKVRWEVDSVAEEKVGETPVITKHLVGHVDNSSFPGIAVNIQLTLTTPKGASRAVPVIMEFGFGGNFAGRMPGAGTGPTWQQQLIDKGWGYSVIVPTSYQADDGSGLTKGIIGLCNKGQVRKPDDWGALRAWAWGASRALDYFETDRSVNAKEVGIEGLSRYGKATLVTMAYDQRFAIGFVGSSGAGGAKLHRRDFGEKVENLTGTGEYHWMAGNYLKYGGPLTAKDLPVDSHELIAMCAPRPVLISCGSPNVEGIWVDDRGMFMATVAAGPVYQLLGKKNLGTDEMPPEGTGLTDGDLAFRQHSGGHTTGPNWPTFITFASRYFDKGSSIVIDATGGKPISKYIYGVNYAGNYIYDWLKEWQDYHQDFSLAREGGNRLSAYNWETNASNAGADWFNQNDNYLATSNEPGWTVSRFLQWVQSTGAAALVTVPTLGYVSADKIEQLNGSQDVGKTPDYLNTRFYKSYASKPGHLFSYPPDKTDKAVYQDEFVAWVEATKSPKSPVWFSLDNEPDLWSSTHSRLWTSKPGYATICQNNAEYAAAIKRVAPDSLIFGPANYGYNGIMKFQDAPDGAGRVFADVYLDSMREAGRSAGRRLLDVYDFHWYPEATGGGKRIIADGPENAESESARVQAPRSLWDPSYVEKSWITDSNGQKPIELVPYMNVQIEAHYPGTKLAITEYDFGGRNTVSGALAQADALGIFGRYGIFAACHWGLNHGDIAAMAGFKAFTNYDRKGARFGDIELRVAGEDPGRESFYAARDSNDPARLTVVIVNKCNSINKVSLALKGFRARKTMAFVIREGVFTVPEVHSIQPTQDGFNFEAPSLSVTTLELRSSSISTVPFVYF